MIYYVFRKLYLENKKKIESNLVNVLNLILKVIQNFELFANTCSYFKSIETG